MSSRTTPSDLLQPAFYLAGGHYSTSHRYPRARRTRHTKHDAAHPSHALQDHVGKTTWLAGARCPSPPRRAVTSSARPSPRQVPDATPMRTIRRRKWSCEPRARLRLRRVGEAQAASETLSVGVPASSRPYTPRGHEAQKPYSSPHLVRLARARATLRPGLC